jgi:[protein-PII] uridylyltransferase
MELFADSGLIVLGIGSLGTMRFAPTSDLDLAFLHKKNLRSSDKNLIEDFLYAVWGSGLGIDHSTRDIRDLERVAFEDPRVFVGLATAQVFSGDGPSFFEAREKLLSKATKKCDRLLGPLEIDAEQRIERYGELDSLNEPNLKQSFGGLRDLAVADALAACGMIAGIPAEASRELVGARVELRRFLGRPEERLDFDNQAVVAKALSMARAELMQSIGNVGREVADQLREAFDGCPKGPKRRMKLGLPAGPIERRKLLESLARISAADRLPYTGELADASARLDKASVDQPMSERERGFLIEMLEAGDSLWPLVRGFERSGLMATMFPWFEPAIGFVQNNPYHKYRLDRHLMETVRVASRLRREVNRPDLLLIASLLHDIGKVADGDHSESGAEIASQLVQQLGLSQSDAQVVVKLVRHHLLLVDSAFRRDPHDLDTVFEIARILEHREILELAAVLSEADSRATGTQSWSEWKARLMWELVDQVERVMLGEDPTIGLTGVSDDELAELLEAGKHGAEIRFKEGRVIVAIPDRKGLLAMMSGILLAHHLEVVAVDALTIDGVAIESILVNRIRKVELDLAKIRSRLARAEADPDYVWSLVEQTRRTYGTKSRKPSPNPRIVIRTDPVPSVEVRTSDRLGLLYDLASAIAEVGYTIRAARVQTLGQDVVDTFYLVDVPEGDDLSALNRALFPLI